MDIVDAKTRSRMMAAVRGKDTLPERTVRRFVHGLGYRFRLHRRDLPGCPDLVFPRHRAVIFVNGCFWHQHKACPKGTPPAVNRKFWVAKLKRNRERDRQTVAALRGLGWDVLIIWECETKDPHRLRDLILSFLG